MNRDHASDQKKYDRAAHLADLNRDIQNWKAEVERLELDGHTAKANAVRNWIKSAEHLADLLKRMPNT